MQKAERAISLDLDGVVIWRPPFQLGAFVKRHVKRQGAGMYAPPEEIPELSREIKDDHLKPSELVSYLMHVIRPVTGSAREFIDENFLTADIFANTGRAARTPWVNMTKRTLEHGGLHGAFEDYFFKPEGVKTMASKLEAVSRLREQYRYVTHYDDNPADALPIAERFPDVHVVIVQDLSTGMLYSRDEAQRYPNVTRIAKLRPVNNTV